MEEVLLVDAAVLADVVRFTVAVRAAVEVRSHQSLPCDLKVGTRARNILE